MQILNSLLVYCRAGFEAEAAHETVAALGELDIRAEPKFVPLQGFALVVCNRPLTVADSRRWDARNLIFVRQAILTSSDILQLDPKDRVSWLVAATKELSSQATTFSTVWIEHPDTNEGKELSGLARGLEAHLIKALGAAVVPGNTSGARLHVFLQSGTTARVGCSWPGRSSSWRLGIPRLRMPSGAPSRSTLKMSEALMGFLGEREPDFLKPEMRAIDLGAAPGGWTWQLIHRGLHVTAVDNANLHEQLVDNALVKHLREDGFHYRPKRPVDWLVCDMVERPSRIAALVADWVASNTAQHAIFNLKLPMKKRIEEVERCKAIIAERMEESGVSYFLRLKHLYHDREEVTAFLTRHAKRFE